MFVGRMWKIWGISISVNISDLLVDHVRSVVNVVCMTKRTRKKVPFVLICMLIPAVKEARIRATKEYLARHPEGVFLLKHLMCRYECSSCDCSWRLFTTSTCKYSHWT